MNKCERLGRAPRPRRSRRGSPTALVSHTAARITRDVRFALLVSSYLSRPPPRQHQRIVAAPPQRPPTRTHARVAGSHRPSPPPHEYRPCATLQLSLVSTPSIVASSYPWWVALQVGTLAKSTAVHLRGPRDSISSPPVPLAVYVQEREATDPAEVHLLRPVTWWRPVLYSLC